jgi:adenylate kinase family enzyme
MGELYTRADDSREKLAKRFDAYKKDTLPVVDELRNSGRLITVHAGTKSADEVEALVRDALGLPKK